MKFPLFTTSTIGAAAIALIVASVTIQPTTASAHKRLFHKSHGNVWHNDGTKERRWKANAGGRCSNAKYGQLHRMTNDFSASGPGRHTHGAGGSTANHVHPRCKRG